MKKMKRILVIMLAMVLLVTSLTGCQNDKEQVEDVFHENKSESSRDDEVKEDVVEEEETAEKEATEEEITPSEPDSDEPAGAMAVLKYTLSEEDIAEFESQLLLCEEMLKNGASYEEMEKEADILDEMTCEIQDQASIAQVLYYCDIENEEAVDNYLFSSEVSTELTSEYLNFLIALYEDGNYAPYFDDLLDIELEYLECYSDETTDLSIRNSEILTEFHDLQEDEIGEKLGALYSEFVNNSNEIAAESGFANYYDYMTKFGYMRDYGSEEREKFREYVKAYIVPSQYVAYELYEEAYDKLSRDQKKIVDALLYNEYDADDTDYVMNYLDSLPEAAKNGMQHMFENEMFIVTDYKDAYEGAFTVDINGPLCYFGPGYNDYFTVIHELGHYYGYINSDSSWMSYDLCETHSQGNEMLFLSYLSTVLEPEVYKALEAYMLFNSVDIIAMATMMDDFEERVYNMPAPVSFTTEELEELMNEIILEYGFAEDDEYTHMYLDYVWKNVCISSPVYYLSYATSAMAAFSIYSQSLEDYEQALESYRIIQEEVGDEGKFAGSLEKAGIPSVFEKDVYLKLQEILDGEKPENVVESFSPGKVGENTYESPFIGLGCTLEDGWSFYTDEQIRELNNATLDVVGEEYEELLSNAQLIYDMYAVGANRADSINVTLEKVNNIILSVLSVEDIFKQNLPMLEGIFSDMGYSDVQMEVITVTIDGKDFSGMSLSGEINGMMLYQKSIGVKCNGYLANIAVTSYGEDLTDALLENFYIVE